MHDKKLRIQAKRLHKTVKLLRGRLMRKHPTPSVSRASGGKVELSVSQLNAMITIRDRREVSVTELAGALDVSPPSASVMVDRLVELKMLNRESRKSDRRVVRVTLTPGGAKIVDAIEDEVLGIIEEILIRLGPEDSGKWCDVYTRIHSVLTDWEGRPQAAAGNGA